MTDPSIESLLTELVTYAGHQALHDSGDSAAGTSIRRLRPDIVLVDTAATRGLVKASMRAADEVGARILLVSSIASENELASEAAAFRRPYFALPGGPIALRQSIARVLGMDDRYAGPAAAPIPIRPPSDPNPFPRAERA